MRDLVLLVLAVIVAALAFCGGVRCRGGLSVLMNWNEESKHWSANDDLCSTYQLPGSIAHHNPVRAPARSSLTGRGGPKLPNTGAFNRRRCWYSAKPGGGC